MNYFIWTREYHGGVSWSDTLPHGGGGGWGDAGRPYHFRDLRAAAMRKLPTAAANRHL